MPVYTGDKFGFGKAPASGSGGSGGDGTGEAFFPEPGQYDWVCPAGVTSVCVVCVGGGGGATMDEQGGGGGGGLGYKNNISVTPGNTYKVQVGSGGVGDVNPGNYGCRGGDSWFVNTTTVYGQGGGGTGCSANGTQDLPGYGGRGGVFAGDGGGNGGNGGDADRSNLSDSGSSTGGGGAGGYDGDGGKGGDYNGGNWSNGTNGNNGAGGGGWTTTSGSSEYWGGGGGGVGMYGRGRNGSSGSGQNYGWCGGGYGGSGGSQGWGNPGDTNGNGQLMGGQFGGGGGSSDQHGGYGGSGAVRIIWGTGRSFPKTACDDYWSGEITRYTAPTAGDPTTTSSNWFRGGLGDSTSYGSNYNYNGIVPNISSHANLNGDFTAECWIYCERLSDNTRVFSNSWAGIIFSGRPNSTDDGNHFGSLSIKSNGTQATGPYKLTYHINGTDVMETGFIIPQSTWQHVAITRNNQRWDLWVNGVRGTTSSWTGSNSGSTLDARSDRPVIGAWGYGGRMQVSSWFGNISNFRITKGASLYGGNWQSPDSTYTVPSFPLTTDAPSGATVECLTCGVSDNYEVDLTGSRVWSGPNCMPSTLGPGAPTKTVMKKGYRIWGRHRGLGGGTITGANGSAGDGGLLSTWKKSTGSFQTEQFSTHQGWSASNSTADGISINVSPAGSYATGDNASAKWNLRSISYGQPSNAPRNQSAGFGPFIQNVEIRVMEGKNSGDTVIYDSGQFTLRLPSYNKQVGGTNTQYSEENNGGAFEIELPNGGAENLNMNTWYSVYIKGLAHPNVNDWNSTNGTPGAADQSRWWSEQPVSWQANAASYNLMRYAPSTSGDSDQIGVYLEQANFNDTTWANNNHGAWNPNGQFPFFGIDMPINFMKDPIPAGGGSSYDINGTGLVHYWNATANKTGATYVIDSVASNNITAQWGSISHSSTRGGEVIIPANTANGYFSFAQDVTFGYGYSDQEFTFFWCGEKSANPWWMLATGSDGNNFIGYNGGTLRLDSNQDTKGDLSYSSMNMNTLYCVYMTMASNGAMTWYVNGSHVGNSNYSGSWSSHNVIFDSFNHYDSGGSFQTAGKFYFAGFYSRVLSAVEISSNWTAHQTRLGI